MTGLADKLTGDKYDFDRKGSSKRKIGEERTPAKGDDSFSQEYKDNAKKAIKASQNKNKNKNKKDEESYNIKTTDNPEGGLRDKNNERSYPSGVGSGG